MSKLSETEIVELLAECPEWNLDSESGALVRHFEFPTFADAIAFINRVATIADEHDHHPDIDIRYRRLKFSLISHDVGGLTRRDRSLVHRIDGKLD